MKMFFKLFNDSEIIQTRFQGNVLRNAETPDVKALGSYN